MYIININIDENREVTLSSKKGGNINENNSTILNFTIPHKYSDYYKYLDIQKGDKGKTQSVISTENEFNISYTLPYPLTYGTNLSMQLVLKKDSEIFKSNIFSITFNGSICATQKLESDFQDSIQFIMENKADTVQVERLDERKLDKSIFYDFTNHQNIINTNKADKDDASLRTESKNLAGAINELFGSKADLSVTDNLDTKKLDKNSFNEYKNIQNEIYEENETKVNLLKADIDKRIKFIEISDISNEDIIPRKIIDDLKHESDVGLYHINHTWLGGTSVLFLLVSYEGGSIYQSLSDHCGNIWSRYIAEDAISWSQWINPVATKAYVNTKIGDIEAALDELHTYAEALKGGA